ncbi:MAG: T9SS type A sorting domain-containing protein, partial [Ignavibacteria bacterium]|nr:T9SS type A sorting domain-containing protein [Ignavibacteria bacterium]
PCLDIKGAEVLNNSIIVVIDGTNLLYANMETKPELWEKVPTKFSNIVKLLRINDTLLIAIGSKGGNPYYALYNNSGSIIEEGNFGCYQGEFKDVSISEDGIVLLTAQIFKLRDLNQWEFFFIILNSEIVNKVLKSKFTNTEEKERTDLLIYPNPTEGKIYFSGNFDASNLFVDVFDRFGRKVVSFSSLQTNYIELIDISSGIYFIEIRYGDKIERTKFIKLNN